MDDITALLSGKHKEVAEMSKTDEEVERSREKRPHTASHGKREGRKGQDDCFVRFFEGRAASMQQRKRSDDGRQCRNTLSVLEN